MIRMLPVSRQDTVDLDVLVDAHGDIAQDGGHEGGPAETPSIYRTSSAPTSTRDEPHVGTHICGETPYLLFRMLERTPWNENGGLTRWVEM